MFFSFEPKSEISSNIAAQLCDMFETEKFIINATFTEAFDCEEPGCDVFKTVNKGKFTNWFKRRRDYAKKMANKNRNEKPLTDAFIK